MLAQVISMDASEVNIWNRIFRARGSRFLKRLHSTLNLSTGDQSSRSRVIKPIRNADRVRHTAGKPSTAFRNEKCNARHDDRNSEHDAKSEHDASTGVTDSRAHEDARK